MPQEEQVIIEEDGSAITIPQGAELSLVTDKDDEEAESMALEFLEGADARAGVRKQSLVLEAALIKKVGKKGGWLAKKLLELADGIWMVKKHEGKKVLVYKRAPDIRAIELILRYALGTPPKKPDGEEEGSGSKAVEGILKELATATKYQYKREKLAADKE